MIEDLYPNFSSMSLEDQKVHIRTIRLARDDYFLNSKKVKKVKISKIVSVEDQRRSILAEMGILPENMDEALELMEKSLG